MKDDNADYDDSRSRSSSDGFSDNEGDNEHNDRFLMEQESRAMERRSWTVGFREGIDVGKEETLQEGFNAGYLVGASQGFRSGVLHGLLRSYTSQFPNLASTDHVALLATLREKEQSSITRGDIPSTNASDVDAVHAILASAFPNFSSHMAAHHDKANHPVPPPPPPPQSQ